MRYKGRYTPPSLKGSIIYPGNFGTFNWGGVAIDPERQVVFAMPVYLAFTSTLKARTDATSRIVTKPDEPPFNENFGAPYAAQMGAFLSRSDCRVRLRPGDVRRGRPDHRKTVYRHVNGTVRDCRRSRLPFRMGVPGIGGPMITKGGVAFLSGTLDYFARAYGVTSGKQLWENRLPAGGQATPMTYCRQAGANSSLWSLVAMARPVPKRATPSLPMRYQIPDAARSFFVICRYSDCGNASAPFSITSLGSAGAESSSRRR